MDENQVARMAERIVRTYHMLKREPRSYVSITRIADHIDGTPELIRAAYTSLLILWDDVVIVPENNQKVLTQADWDAAVWIGGQWKHLIAIGV